MSPRRVIVFGGLLFAACIGPLDLYFAIDDATTAAIVVVQRERSLTVEAIDESGLRPFRLAYEDEDVLATYVFEYERSLAELDIPIGTLDSVEPGVASRALPASARVHVRELEGDEWRAITELPPALADFRFKRTTIDECLAEGGCYLSDPARSSCVRPCPTPPAPTPPELPAPPNFPCPPGWEISAPRGDDDAAACEPYAGVRVPNDCPAGSHHLPGTAGCSLIGAACPTGPFAEDLPAGTVYVAPGGGGDGTRAAPYASIAEAVAAAPEGGTIALAKGELVGGVTIDRPVSLRGACAALTRVVANGETTFVVTSSGAAIADLSARGQAAIVVRGGVLRVSGLDLDGGAFAGLSVVSGEVSGGGLVFDDGRGGVAVDGGEARLERVSGRDLPGAAVSVTGGSLTLSDFVFDGVDGNVVVVNAGEATLRRGLGRGFTFTGVHTSARGVVNIEDVVLRDSAGDNAGGVFVASGGRAFGTRVLIERARGAAIGVSGGEAAFKDTVVRETDSVQSTGQFGHGADAYNGGTLRLERTVFWELRGTGIFALASGTTIDLKDVVVAETRGWRSTGEIGVAVRAIDSGRIDFERLRVVRAHGFGVVAAAEGIIGGTDLTVSDTLPRDENGAYGRGAEVSGGAQLEVTRAVFERGRSVAVFVLDFGSEVRLTDVRMSGTTESACVGFSCNSGLADGISVILGATATVERFEIVDNAQYGVRIVNNPQLTLRDGRIANNAVGIQSVSPAFDLGRIAQGVLLEDNARQVVLVEP